MRSTSAARRLSLLLTCFAGPVSAQITLVLPIDCVLGSTCYIQQGVDHDPSQAASDFLCGHLTYDGHKGTDFAVPSLAAQTGGVNVLAAASGVVRGVRNDMQDILQISPVAPDIAGRECGNGVVITHPDGWETQYCHMAQGSIGVSLGQQVQTGQVLGQVGLSGQTQFPHVHLSVRHNGTVIDPFDPDGDITCGAPSSLSLWETPVSFAPSGLISTGFAGDVPTYDVIKAGTANTENLSTKSALVVWGNVFGPQAGATIAVTITGPDSREILRQTAQFDRDQAQAFRALGRRAPPNGWPTGTYDATVTLSRNGALIDSETLSVTVSD